KQSNHSRKSSDGCKCGSVTNNYNTDNINNINSNSKFNNVVQNIANNIQSHHEQNRRNNKKCIEKKLKNKVKQELRKKCVDDTPRSTVMEGDAITTISNVVTVANGTDNNGIHNCSIDID